MRGLLRATLVGGILFLVPLVVVVMVLGKAFQILKTIATPLDKLIPIDSLAGFAFVELLTAVIMIMICLIAGLIAKSDWGRSFYAKVDEILLHLIPGYAWVKGVTGEISDEEARETFRPVLVRLDDQYLLGLEADRRDDGLVAVFLPGAPDVRSGTLSYVTTDRVQPIDASLKAFSRAFKTLGRDSEKVF
jgi:uncharacterized membrane protein